MNSHTVPQKLLKQFAYEDLRTKSLRLYCYKKGIPPYPVSPKRATAFEGYFSDPDNPAKENEIETRSSFRKITAEQDLKALLSLVVEGLIILCVIEIKIPD